MPIKVQRDLPAKAILESENIFIMDEDRAMSQDIRPLEILILNLMPLKEDTETQLLRALSIHRCRWTVPFNAVYPCVQKHICQSFKQVLCFL